jgi:hypothetical protein
MQWQVARHFPHLIQVHGISIPPIPLWAHLEEELVEQPWNRTALNGRDEKSGLRRDAAGSQVIDVPEAQEIKETGNEEGQLRTGTADDKVSRANLFA